MNDPQPAHLKNKPRRAEPLQPDNLGRGDETGTDRQVDLDDPNAGSPGDEKASDKDASEESPSENALKNVTEGYK